MSKNIYYMNFLGKDEWSRDVYKCTENKRLYKDINCGKSENIELYSCNNEFEGEPAWPINDDVEIIYVKNDTIEFLNIANVKIILKGEIQKITTNIIEELKVKNDPIFWSDTTCKHYICDFKINGLWFENVNINNELTEMIFNVFE